MTNFFDRYANFIERIPVPERSGCKGVLLALSFLYAFLTGFGGGGDPFCGIHPWSCEAHAATAVATSFHWRMLETLEFGKGKRRAQCTCHIDMSYREDRTLMGHANYNGIPCGTFPADYHRDWEIVTDNLNIGPWVFRWGRTMQRGFPGYIRLHCSDDPQYAPQVILVPAADDDDSVITFSRLTSHAHP